MQHAHFASFAVGVVAMLVVDIVVTEVASRWIFFSLSVDIPAVAASVLTTAVTTRS